MKLIIPLAFIVLGVGVGYLISIMLPFTAKHSGIPILAGGVGAFAGVVIRDAFDLAMGSPFWGTLGAACIGACVLATLAIILARK